MACDVRLAAFSASFGQPEINLGIIPGFGGTQRLPRLVGPAKALEMNTTGEPISAEEAYEFGLVNRVVADHELFDTALAWARKFARPGAARARADQARLAPGRPRRGHRGREGRASPPCSRPRTRARASARSSASARRSSRARERARRPPCARGWPSCCARPTGSSRSPAPGSPCRRGSRTSARRGTGLWANVDPMEVAHIDVFRRDPERFWGFYGHRFAPLRDKRPNGAHRALAELERRGRARGGRDAEHRRPAPRRRHARPDRGARLDRARRRAWRAARGSRSPRCARGWRRRRTACRAATAARR